MWDLTARIYSEIGHTVELSTVRDVVNSRIEAINHQLAEEKYIAEETYRVTEQKSIDEVDCRDTQEDANFHSKVTAVLGKFGGDEGKAKVFVRVRNIISDKLEVDESKINLDCHMSNHLNMDDLDLVKSKDLDGLNSNLRQGVSRHYAIDKFTDSHPIVKISKKRIDKEYSKFAGILIDVFTTIY